MTCIVALKDEGSIYIGGDRLATAGYGRKYHLAQQKVWKKGPEMIFGGAGDVRGIQLLAYTSAIPPMKEGQSIEEYLAMDFSNALKNALHAGGDLHNKHNVEESFSQFLLGFRGRLFAFYQDFAFIEVVEDFTSIGSGGDYAIGSLYSTQGTDMTPEERITKALECAEYYDAYVQGDYDIVSIPCDSKKEDPLDNVMDNILTKANQMMAEDD